MLFRRLSVSGWQQFAVLDVEFHSNLTVLTGANGSGKTTVLRFLARHFAGWSFVNLRTPRERSAKGLKYWFSTLIGESEERTPEIGTISYDDGHRSPIRLPDHQDTAAYQLTIDKPAQVQGFFIPSHRQEFRYQRVPQLQLSQRPWRASAFDSVHSSMRAWATGGGGNSSVFQLKETLVSLAHFGYDSEVVAGDPEARKLFEGFQQVLRIVLPPELGSGLARWLPEALSKVADEQKP